MASGLNRLEQVFRELAEPFRHWPWRRIAHQCGQKQRFGDVDAELTVSLELLMIEELVQCRLVWELRVIDPVSLDELGFIAGHRELQVEQQSGALGIMNAAENENDTCLCR